MEIYINILIQIILMIILWGLQILHVSNKNWKTNL